MDQRADRILVFFPALDEEESVARVVSRVPPTACGREVDVLVVDDGSTDRTAVRARAAGAEVISFDRNRGLGAAVRAGLSEGASRSAVATVFLDADEEYAPEEMERLVTPILTGEADYVVGSRFSGCIERMRPHRRFGNRVLTWLLSLATRRRITDGQSGFRALSRRAAQVAEIIHDYNYAQVLTLDLLSKGLEYREVPISYRFRTTGSSFIRPLLYARRCVPAVLRELATSPELLKAHRTHLGPRTTPAAGSVPPNVLTSEP